jgi:hypothetical protein
MERYPLGTQLAEKMLGRWLPDADRPPAAAQVDNRAIFGDHSIERG